MGTVHAAEVTEAVAGLEAGQKVAVKVIHPHLLASPGFFKRFMREAELGRKVVHENVVRTFDVDALLVDDKHVNFMVMEHVEGKSLRELLNDLGTVPETLLREIALQATAGLGAIHASEIVHRDIKPENILITDTHEVRIMDLGVAKLQEASIAITKEGQFAGSLLYAAPEQFGPDEVGAAVDLYSLGVLLYELATGDNPFRRDDAAAVIEAHLKLQPPRITDLNTETTTFFAELVAMLLAKRPADRFESAQVLHEVLAEAERSLWWTELAPKLRKKVAHLPKIRVRQETELHGRDGDLKTLSQAWEKARSGEGNTVFIEGEAGIGKTRLLDAFLRGLDDKDIHVLYGSYPPSGGLGGVSDAIIEKFGEAMLLNALAPYLTVTPSLVPAFAALVKHEGPPTGSEPLQGDALHAVCVHLMRALAEEKPLVWIIEDLHFAPKESRDTVLALARAVEGHRVLLVATARPAVPDDEIANFSRLENYRRIVLDRLGAREVIELLEDAFKSEALAEKLGVRIAKKSDGVPFFVFEMIRGLKEGQFIRQQPDGSYVQTQVIDEIEVPSAVKDLIEGRLRDLSDEDRNVLDVAAVQGMDFDSGLVADVLELKRVQVLQRLAAIERRSGVVRAEGRRYRFDQNQIQEVLYASVADELSSEYHTLLAEVYAERCGDEPKGDDAVFLTHHHLRGSRPKEALPHLTPALEHLGKSYRNDAAIELAARALDIHKLLEGKERVEVLLKKAGQHGLRGERETERAALDEALALADRQDAALRAEVRVPLGVHLIETSDYAAAQEWLRQGLDLAREAEDQKTEARATGNLGRVFLGQGRYEEAREQFEKHLALSREIGDRRGEASATGNVGLVFLGQGRYEEARAQIERCLALSREIGDRRGEASATGNLGAAFRGQGRHEEARAHQEKYLALSREIGNRQSEATATGSLGLVFLGQGRYEEAREQFEEFLALSREIGDQQGEGIALVNLGSLQAALGQTDLARETLNESLRVLREIGARRPEGYALEGLGFVAEQRGEMEDAHRFHEEALALRREISYTSGVASTLVALGRLEALQGDERAATAHIGEAISLAQELQTPNLILLAAVERARLRGGDIEAALAALDEHEERVPHDTKMDARFRLWELTNDKAHLEEAHRLLTYLRDHAPEDCRDSMIENVPLHRDIMKAWEEHGHG
jgi:serine/threonine protein kinase/tetratricopeptide (TPR) repeat protein